MLIADPPGPPHRFRTQPIRIPSRVLLSACWYETYKAHLDAITTTTEKVERAIGAGVQEALSKATAANAEGCRYWSEYYKLDFVAFPDVVELAPTLSFAHQTMKALLDRKRLSRLDRLDRLDGGEELRPVESKLEWVASTVAAYRSAAGTGRGR